MALATIIPLSSFIDLRFELYGWLYLTLPDKQVYSAEDYAIFTPSIQYRPLNWLAVDLGIDRRLNPGDRNRTSGVPPIVFPIDKLANYPPWKVQIGLHFDLNPNKKQDSLIDQDRADVKKMVDFYEMIEQEKDKSRQSEQKQQELSKDRREADKEVKKIKKSLEGED